jgi:hypothetical protein
MQEVQVAAEPEQVAQGILQSLQAVYSKNYPRGQAIIIEKIKLIKRYF